MFDDTLVLTTAWLNQEKLATRPARTLVIGAALLFVRQRFSGWSLELQTHSTTVTDNTTDTMLWLGERLGRQERLLLWRAEDIVVPSLIAAADTAVDTVAAAAMLRSLDRAFTGEVVDVAAAYGRHRAVSFDAVAHQHGLALTPMTQANLAEAHEAMDHGRIRDHVGARAIATWRLWLGQQPNEELSAATATWLAEQEARA